MRLAVCLSHPIQYKSPLLRVLAQQPKLQLQVFYYSNRGIVGKKNAFHGTIPVWDIPLLDGYKSEFLPNLVDEEKWRLSVFQPFINPSVISRLLTGNYDAVIIHSYQYPSDWFAFLTAKFKRIKVLFFGEMYPRGHISLGRRIGRLALHRPMLRGVDACLAISSVARQVFEDEYQILPERIFLAPYTVDNDFFIGQVEQHRPNKDKIKTDLGIPEEIPVVLCVAAMVPKKQQHHLVEALAKTQTPSRLVLVGHGPLLEQIKALCQKVLPNTILTGFINQSQLPRYYAMADVFVLPSSWEEFGLVVNEAMCAGLPVLATNSVAAARDLISEGQNGYTFNPGDVDTLAVYLERLLSDQILRERFGRKSQEIISGWGLSQTTHGIMDALNFSVNGVH
jgi:glycosyltransferase involved in cell wall biosynthesis